MSFPAGDTTLFGHSVAMNVDVDSRLQAVDSATRALSESRARYFDALGGEDTVPQGRPAPGRHNTSVSFLLDDVPVNAPPVRKQQQPRPAAATDHYASSRAAEAGAAAASRMTHSAMVPSAYTGGYAAADYRAEQQQHGVSRADDSLRLLETGYTTQIAQLHDSIAFVDAERHATRQELATAMAALQNERGSVLRLEAAVQAAEGAQQQSALLFESERRRANLLATELANERRAGNARHLQALASDETAARFALELQCSAAAASLEGDHRWTLELYRATDATLELAASRAAPPNDTTVSLSLGSPPRRAPAGGAASAAVAETLRQLREDLDSAAQERDSLLATHAAQERNVAMWRDRCLRTERRARDAEETADLCAAEAEARGRLQGMAFDAMATAAVLFAGRRVFDARRRSPSPPAPALQPAKLRSVDAGTQHTAEEPAPLSRHASVASVGSSLGDTADEKDRELSVLRKLLMSAKEEAAEATAKLAAATAASPHAADKTAPPTPHIAASEGKKKVETAESAAQTAPSFEELVRSGVLQHLAAAPPRASPQPSPGTRSLADPLVSSVPAGSMLDQTDFAPMSDAAMTPMALPMLSDPSFSAASAPVQQPRAATPCAAAQNPDHSRADLGSVPSGWSDHSRDHGPVEAEPRSPHGPAAVPLALLPAAVRGALQEDFAAMTTAQQDEAAKVTAALAASDEAHRRELGELRKELGSVRLAMRNLLSNSSAQQQKVAREVVAMRETATGVAKELASLRDAAPPAPPPAAPVSRAPSPNPQPRAATPDPPALGQLGKIPARGNSPLPAGPVSADGSEAEASSSPNKKGSPTTESPNKKLPKTSSATSAGKPPRPTPSPQPRASPHSSIKVDPPTPQAPQVAQAAQAAQAAALPPPPKLAASKSSHNWDDSDDDDDDGGGPAVGSDPFLSAAADVASPRSVASRAPPSRTASDAGSVFGQPPAGRRPTNRSAFDDSTTSSDSSDDSVAPVRRPQAAKPAAKAAAKPTSQTSSLSASQAAALRPSPKPAAAPSGLSNAQAAALRPKR